MEQLSQKKKVTIMIALMAAMFFAAINQTIVSTAMPRIIAMLGGIEYYTWVITIYMLTSTIATVLVGKLSDIYGRKPFLLFGIVIFIIGAFLSGTSTTIFQMITYRGIQGLGGGILMSATVTAVGDLFAPRERAKWTGVMMAIFGFSSVIGPTLGGFMVDHMDWEWIFWIFLPLGLVAFVMIWRMFPKTGRTTTEPIDYWGSLFLSLTIIALLLGFSWAGTKYEWGSFEIIGLLAASAVFLVILLLVERKAKSPVLPLSMFKNSIVTVSNVIGFLMNAGMMGAMMYLPFFTQGVLGISPTVSGFVNMPMSIAMIVLSTLSGRWISKSGKYKRFAIAGMPFMVIGMLMMAFMTNVWIAIASMIVFGIGLGISMPVFTLTVQNAVAPSQLGVATGTATLFRNLGGTIGIAVMGTVMNTTLTHKLRDALAAGEGPDLSKVDPEVAQEMGSFMNPQLLLDQPKLKELQETLPTEIHDLFNQTIAFIRDVLSDSLTVVFLFGMSLLIVALVAVFFLKEIPLRTSNDMKAEASPADRKTKDLTKKEPAIQ
ncbi:MDR family MFS transporter [Paenibacillus harenae]|uniref:EmrB/QacA subfamily drug resistance transporter n=1 Tax=Paenibacillus harenae TaxID=306543 RepID=A0ABT9TX43_PAEHA|nr:MDR family MFS transporter [Paenibacillus harenae]MDQ0058606.1 EmrB/QacA subfamily drug resistance transporter [Paenibacillus harenae]MDQ0111943.1 EmrB/QacA subfamily drug resistance transporter [Paenibacillus harenae]